SFQAEDGIRDRNVTGVQTCALPISFPGQFCRTIRQVGPSHCLRNNRCNPLSDALSPGTPPTLRGTHRRARFTPTPRGGGRMTLPTAEGDRKSTRLNSSHVSISYAVFCVTKKKIVQPAYSRTYYT